MKKFTKIALAVASFVLVAALSVGGTLAWLTAKTNVVTNTFSPTGIEIKLEETMNPDGSTEDENKDDIPDAITDWKVQMIPGETYSKNPTVTVVQPDTNVEVYLFVKFDETVDEDDIDYDITLDDEGSGWTRGTGDNGDKVPENVWYRRVPANADKNSWDLLNGNKVTIKNITEADMPTVEVTMNFSAYAIQTLGFDTVGDAWTEVVKLDNTTNG